MASHLTPEERDRITQLRHQGADQKQIAEAIGRSLATITFPRNQLLIALTGTKLFAALREPAEVLIARNRASVASVHNQFDSRGRFVLNRDLMAVSPANRGGRVLRAQISNSKIRSPLRIAEHKLSRSASIPILRTCPIDSAWLSIPSSPQD